MVNPVKESFLKNEMIPLLASIPHGTAPLWGKMNLQQMIEHLSDSIRIVSGKIPKQLMTPADKLPAFREFMLSETPFKENTKNREMGEEPEPVRLSSVQAALDELQVEMNDFFTHFDDPEKRVMNPFFGDMNYEEWVHLFHKHAVHHLKQFGVTVQ
jgi:hypothetical protein